MTVSYLNPAADCITPPKSYDLSVDIDQHLVIGLVINKIPDCDRFMDEVEKALLCCDRKLTVKKFYTGKITYADGKLIDQIANECNAAICAIGHCGSCTAGTVKDGLALIERGIPAISLVTALFWEQSTMLARSQGWPEAPRIKLPYPVWGTDPASLRDVASTTVNAVWPLLENQT